MTVNRTTLLDLPLPVTGTGSGTWGDTTNNGLSQYTDIAIAGMNSLTSANFTAGALTIANTLGDSLATNIAAGSAQFSTIKVSSLAQNSTITAPGNSGTPPVYSGRSYRIINADATYSLTIKASGQTGVTFLPGQTGVVAFNGTDYVIVGVVGAGTATDNAVARFDGTTGKLVQNSVVTIADSTGDVAGVGALTMGGNLTLSGGTANGVLYLNGSKVATSGSALTFDGTNTFRVNGGSSGFYKAYSGEVVVGEDATGIYYGAGAGVAPAVPLYFGSTGTTFQRWQAGGSEQMRLTSTGLGIGTSSPSQKLHLSVASGSVYSQITSGTNQMYMGYANGIGGTLQSNNLLAFYTGASYTQNMVLDSSGNLGLGVTPSAWDTGNSVRAIQLPAGAVWSFSTLNVYLGANNYWNGTNRIYSSTNTAGEYNINGNVHTWRQAASGTAGNAITFTQAMTLDASGNLGVGTTSPSAKLHVQNQIYVKGTGGGDGAIGIDINSGASAVTTSAHAIRSGGGTGNSLIIETQTANSNGQILFQTNGTERARITSGGYFKASDNGAYTGSTAAYHEFYQTANNSVLIVRATNGSYTNDVLTVNGDRATTNATYNLINAYNGAISGQFIVRDSGNAVNTNGSYGTISDAKMKTDIVDAGSQWADIKAIRFRKFKMKNDPSGLVQLGVVAQEVEQTSPGLVDEHIDRDGEGNDLGTTTKSVKTSVLLMKAAVALQEAMARIETLEAKVSALEGN